MGGGLSGRCRDDGDITKAGIGLMGDQQQRACAQLSWVVWRAEIPRRRFGGAILPDLQAIHAGLPRACFHTHLEDVTDVERERTTAGVFGEQHFLISQDAQPIAECAAPGVPSDRALRVVTIARLAAIPVVVPLPAQCDADTLAVARLLESFRVETMDGDRNRHFVIRPGNIADVDQAVVPHLDRANAASLDRPETVHDLGRLLNRGSRAPVDAVGLWPGLPGR